MSREVNYNDLSLEDRKYLQDRDMLPDDVTPVRVMEDGRLADEDEVFDGDEDGDEVG